MSIYLQILPGPLLSGFGMSLLKCLMATRIPTARTFFLDSYELSLALTAYVLIYKVLIVTICYCHQ